MNSCVILRAVLCVLPAAVEMGATRVVWAGVDQLLLGSVGSVKAAEALVGAHQV